MRSPSPASSRSRRSRARSKPGLKYRNVSALSRPAAVTAPNTAEKVWRGTPIQSAHAPHSRESSSNVSPTSNTTAVTMLLLLRHR